MVGGFGRWRLFMVVWIFGFLFVAFQCNGLIVCVFVCFFDLSWSLNIAWWLLLFREVDAMG